MLKEKIMALLLISALLLTGRGSKEESQTEADAATDLTYPAREESRTDPIWEEASQGVFCTRQVQQAEEIKDWLESAIESGGK